MDNKRQELMDVLKKIFADEASARTLVEAQSVKEIQEFMGKGGISLTEKDCEFMLAVKEKNFARTLPEMKSNEEVQTALKEKGFTLSSDECAMLRMMANRSLIELLTKAKSTEEVRTILEENTITLSPEAYSNLEWNQEMDVELSEEELANVAGGSWWGTLSYIAAVCGGLAAIAGLIMVAPATGGASAVAAGAMVASAAGGGGSMLGWGVLCGGLVTFFAGVLGWDGDQ